MDITSFFKDQEHLVHNSLIKTLGIRFFPPDEHGVVVATMPVNNVTCQPYGYLCGGASLALAEILAGVSSLMHCPKGMFPFGAQVSASHTSTVRVGHIVTGKATVVHLGKTLHIWNVDITDESGNLISTARVTNYVGENRFSTK